LVDIIFLFFKFIIAIVALIWLSLFLSCVFFGARSNRYFPTAL
jgi:hypothetical protein